MLYNHDTYNVGIYLRISKEDGDKEESESITNQRKIIYEYLNKNKDLNIHKEYIDDGYSGANFNRPAFKELLHDIDSGSVNFVITKNLARFGRNYIESGEYLEKVFPDKQVRFYAILDNYDNFLERVENDFFPLFIASGICHGIITTSIVEVRYGYSRTEQDQPASRLR